MSMKWVRVWVSEKACPFHRLQPPFKENRLHAFSRDVLTIEDAKGLLQRLDFLLAAGDAVLVADTGVNAGWLQLLVVRKRGVELFLSAIQVRLLLLKRLLLVLFLPRFVLDVLALLRLVDGRVTHELVVLLLR